MCDLWRIVRASVAFRSPSAVRTGSERERDRESETHTERKRERERERERSRSASSSLDEHQSVEEEGNEKE